MKRTVLNVILAVILVGLVAFYWFSQRDYRRPNVRFLPNMEDSVPYNTFAPNPNFTDGKTLQAPPPGTIPYETQSLSYLATPEDAVRAGLELTNPFLATDSAAMERGQVVYLRSCLPCHGPAGEGDGTVSKRGFPPPPSLLAEHALGLKDGQLFHIITYGQGNMPSYAAQVAVDDRWRAVLHVHQLQQRVVPSTASAETTTTATAATKKAP